MSRVLLLDLDHTLYPSSLPTGYAVDGRITRYIEQHLSLANEEADALRRTLSARYGSTLKGLETLHGVEREHYCDFIQDVEDALMPPPDPALRAWLERATKAFSTYLFTNARRDWADRCLAALGFSGMFLGILDIGFMEWIGKPEASAFSKVEAFLRARHGDADILFADDRLDNLAQARRHGWSTVWIRPHDAAVGGEGSLEHRTVDSLLELDPETLA